MTGTVNVVIDSSTACNSMPVYYSATCVVGNAGFEEEQRQERWYQASISRPDLYAICRRLAMKLDCAVRNMRRARHSRTQVKWHTRVQYFGRLYDQAEQRFLAHVETSNV